MTEMEATRASLHIPELEVPPLAGLWKAPKRFCDASPLGLAFGCSFLQLSTVIVVSQNEFLRDFDSG